MRNSRFFWIKQLGKALSKPLLYLLFVTASYFFAAVFLPATLRHSLFGGYSELTLRLLFITALFSGFFWLFINAINVARSQIKKCPREGKAKIIFAIWPLVENSLKIAAFLWLLYIIASVIEFPEEYQLAAKKLIDIAIISAVTITFIRIINCYEIIILQLYSKEAPNDFSSRATYTKIHAFKKIAIAIVVGLALASTLMLFDSLREIGESIFISAGVASAIIAFSAQRSLASVIGFLQLAFTQTVRIGDNIIIEAQIGSIEEITLTYVVIKLWDLRRLIAPVSYFIEKPFINLNTRHATHLLCYAFIYADYTLPVDAVRKELGNILAASKNWDRIINELHVSDIKPDVMELRLLASAENSAKVWELQCEMREKMIAFITAHYPYALPTARIKTRNEQETALR
jgi:small-conductance mechanosensitive channel